MAISCRVNNIGSCGVRGSRCKGRPALVGGRGLSLSALGDYETRGAVGRRLVFGWTGSAAGIIFYRRLIDFVGVARHVDRDTARSGYFAVDRRQWSVRSVYGRPSLALYFGCGGACGSIGMAGLDVWA